MKHVHCALHAVQYVRFVSNFIYFLNANIYSVQPVHST